MLVRETASGQAVHLTVESKGDLLNLCPAEEAQLNCGQAHFDALGVPFVKATSITALLRNPDPL